MRNVYVVGIGITSFTLFSIGPDESKTRMSCVPVPISTARMRI